MSSPYLEVCLAPTGRAKCRCKAKHPIDAGELKLVTWYLPRGRNHLESTSKALRCVSVAEAHAVIDGVTKSGLEVVMHEDLSDRARGAAGSIATSIVDGTESSDLAFRELPVKKQPRGGEKKRKADDADLGTVQAPPEKAKCFVCKVNFARSQEPNATCNGCRPRAEVEAEEKAAAEEQAIDDARTDARDARVESAVASLDLKCPCGNFARRWVPFGEFRAGFEAKMAESAVEKAYDDHDALDAHYDAMLAAYKTEVCDALDADRRCNGCAVAVEGGAM
jgi:hypothetical protein